MTNAMVSKRVGCQFLLLCLTVLLMAGLCFGQPSVGLTHIVGPPTTTVFVSGNGFAANAAIDIYFDTADLALAVTNGTGAFSSIRIQVPAAARPGKHWVTAVTRSTGAAGQKAFLVRTNWAEFGFTPNGKRFNHFENVLSPATVGRIDLHWSFPIVLTSSPAVAYGSVYLSSFGGTVYALNASTGAVRWSLDTTDLLFSSPAVANGMVYVGYFIGVYALDAITGDGRWNFETDDQVFYSPTVANGMVYVGSDDRNVYALDAATGALQWSYTTGSFVDSTPAVANGLVYISSDKFYALDARTGALRWSLAHAGSPPAVANGLVYVSLFDGNFYALNASTGATVWSFAHAGSSPAVANGLVYFNSDKVYALNASTGALRWSFPSLGGSSPAVANGVVYVGGANNKVYALNASTGALQWSFVMSDVVASAPAVANGVLYIACGDPNSDNTPNLYAFDLIGGGLAPTPAQPPNPQMLRPNLNLKVSEPAATALSTNAQD